MTRQHYWIVKGQAAVKRVVSRCILCKKRNVKPREQLMAPLPADRMTPDKPPFSTVGVDFFWSVDGKRKTIYSETLRMYIYMYGDACSAY